MPPRRVHRDRDWLEETVPFVHWSEFQEKWRWYQGEHVTIIGHTGSGKSTLAEEILKRRRYVIIFITKRKDPIQAKFRKEGFHTVTKDWNGDPTVTGEKVMLKPPLKEGKKDLPKQKAEFERALSVIYQAGGWCLYLDEALYITHDLRLEDDAKLLWLQGRTLGISMVVATQRPVDIPLVAYSQATHLFLFRESDEANTKRLAGIGGHDSQTIREAVSLLLEYEFLYLNTRTGEMVRTKVSA